MPKLEALFKEMSSKSVLRLEHGSLSTTYARAHLLPQENSQFHQKDLRIGHLNQDSKDHTTLQALTNNNPTAIGYLLSNRSDAIPEALIQKAKALNISLFSIPPDTTAIDIKNATLRLALNSETSALSYTQITQELLNCLNIHKPERALLDTLHVITDGSFLLLSSDNQTLASSGNLRIPKTRLQELAEGYYPLQIQNETHDTILIHIGSDTSPNHSIFVAVLKSPEHIGLVENSGFMLGLLQDKHYTELQQRNIQREAFLSEWFANSFDSLSFKHQLNTMGFDETASFTVAVAKLVVTTNNLNRQDLSTLLETVQLTAMQFFETMGLTALSSVRPKYQISVEETTYNTSYNPHCIFVFSGANSAAQLEPLNQTLLNLQSGNYRLQLGFSQESHDYSSTSLKSHYQQAQQAALQAQDSPQQFQRPEPLKWLISEQSPDKLQTLLDTILKPIQEADKSGKLFDTLLAFLDEPAKLEDLAKKLDIHINTLRYRLKKIETLTGKSLTHPKHLAEFYVVAEINNLPESQMS